MSDQQWMPIAEYAEKTGVSVRTVQRRVAQGKGLISRQEPREGGGPPIVYVCEADEKAAAEFEKAQARAAQESSALKERFEQLLEMKCQSCDSRNAVTTMRHRYRKQFNRSGRIPKALLAVEKGVTDARALKSGARASVSEAIVERFVEMVKKSACDDQCDPDFMSRPLRKLPNYQRRLQREFPDERVPIATLRRIVKSRHLKRYLQKQDYDDETLKEIWYFKDRPVFDLIQMDGCRLKYVQIRDEKGQWRNPWMIECFDTGSRVLLAMEAYFSETNENGVDIFRKFLSATPFPNKRVEFRPDNADGFKNLERPIHELNRAYSRPEGFWLDCNFARVQKPKDKVHLESSHRLLHNFEDWLICELREKITERVPNVRFKNSQGKIERVTLTRIDIDLEELRALDFVGKYMRLHNDKSRRFSVNGVQKSWVPSEKLKNYLESVDTFIIEEEKTESFLKYGYPKTDATVSRDGRIRYKKRDWAVVEGEFYGGHKSTKVKISDAGGKLYIFDHAKDGICIGEAAPVGEYTATEKVENAARARAKKNDFERLSDLLVQAGADINPELLAKHYRDGLSYDVAARVLETHKPKYDMHPDGFIRFNLFLGDWIRLRDANQDNRVPGFADLGSI